MAAETGGGMSHGFRCSCRACKDDRNRYEQQRREAANAGRPTSKLVDAAPVRAHVLALRAQGMGWMRVADAAGVARVTVSYLLYGHPKRGFPPAKRVHVMNAKRLLAVEFDLGALRPHTLIDATGVHRRLQALVAAGWSNRDIAQRLGVKNPTVYRLLTAELVWVDTYKKVVALHAEMWDQAPPQDTPEQRKWVRLSQRRAVKNGWVRTAAWDDIDDIDETPSTAPVLDDADDVVDEVAVRRVVDGADPSQLTRAEKLAAARLLVTVKGYSPHTVGSRLNLSHHTVRRAAA